MTKVLGQKASLSITANSTDIISGVCIREIGDLTISKNVIDVTCYGDSVRSKIGGLVDLGSVAITLAYKDKTITNALYSALKSDTSYTCVITIPLSTAETLTFSAIVSDVGQSTPFEDLVTTPITLTLDGITEPVWA